jgi:hypothetical protein
MKGFTFLPSFGYLFFNLNLDGYKKVCCTGMVDGGVVSGGVVSGGVIGGGMIGGGVVVGRDGGSGVWAAAMPRP